MKNTVAVRFLAISLLMVGGCAASARMGQMAVTADTVQPIASPLRDTIGVKEVSGGEKTNPLWTSEIGNDEFRGALESSLKSAGLLEKAKDEGRYSLSATLEKVDQPVFGFSTTVTTQVKYALTEKASGKEVYQESISGQYTAKMSDSFYGPKRLRIANEGAARVNIETMIKKLSQLNLAR